MYGITRCIIFICKYELTLFQIAHFFWSELPNLQQGQSEERNVTTGESSHSETGSLHTLSTRTLDRSDAESVATTVSQDSNKENTRPDQDVVLRRKPEYNKVLLRFLNN